MLAQVAAVSAALIPLLVLILTWRRDLNQRHKLNTDIKALQVLHDIDPDSHVTKALKRNVEQRVHAGITSVKFSVGIPISVVIGFSLIFVGLDTVVPYIVSSEVRTTKEPPEIMLFGAIAGLGVWVLFGAIDHLNFWWANREAAK